MDNYLARLNTKTRLFVWLAVLSNVLGNALLRLGMSAMGRIGSFAPGAYLHAFVSPLVVGGVCALLVSMLAEMALMSWADLSYVLPVTALAYVLTAMVGSLFLAEQVPLPHWLGILMLTAGAALAPRWATCCNAPP